MCVLCDHEDGLINNENFPIDSASINEIYVLRHYVYSSFYLINHIFDIR